MVQQELSYDVPQAAIDEFQTKVAALHPELEEKYKTERVIRRFLLSRQLDVGEAFGFWESWWRWRQTHRPELIERVHIAPQLATHVVNIEGRDKRGHSCLVLRPRFHVPGQFSFEEMMRFTVWCLETVSTASKDADGYMTAVWDCGGQGYKNMDASLVTAHDGIIATMKNYYPECLQLLLIVDPNLIFRLIWKVIVPFIDPRTRQKVHMVTDHDELLEYFDPEDLPSDFVHVADKARRQSSHEEAGSSGTASTGSSTE